MRASSSHLQAAFARWCQHSDTAALAELFNMAAPELLRVAVHLSGDVAAAEDLVQGTFLKVIEQRASIDQERADMGWLVTVLRGLAIDRMRRRESGTLTGSEGPDLDRLESRVEAVDHPLERQELSAAIQSAISQLPEPYRQVLTLRLRHGASAPEIADITGVSTGAVRTQLHRGLEKLRSLLPPSLAVALLGHAAPSASGLGAIRSETLEHAARVFGRESAGHTSHLLPHTGGILGSSGFLHSLQLAMTSKLIAVGAVLLASVALFGLLREASTGTTSDLVVDAPVSDQKSAVRNSQPENSIGSLASLASDDAEGRAPVELEETSVPLSHELSGKVIDALTQAPVPGAIVEIFSPRSIPMARALEEHPECFKLDRTGRLSSIYGDSWPIGGHETSASTFLDDPVRMGTTPDEHAVPVATTVSDRNGEFVLDTPAERSLLRVQADGYPPRMSSTQRPPAADDDGDSMEPKVLYLHKNRPYTGQVYGVEPEDFPIELALTCGSDEHGAFAMQITTDASGAFTFEAPGTNLRATSLTPGFYVDRVGHTENGEWLVNMERAFALRFVNEESGMPLERVRIRVENDNGYAIQAGEFFTDDGYLHVKEWFGPHRGTDSGTMKLHAWAPGFQPAFAQLSQDDQARRREVMLTPGELPRVDGRVVTDGIPTPNVVVELVATDRLQWTRDTQYLMHAARTGADGKFRLEGRKGPAALRIRSSAGEYIEEVQLPASQLIEIDLAASGEILIEITNEDGVPVPSHVAVLSGSQGFQVWETTDPDGWVRITGLGPGEYKVRTPLGDVVGGFGDGLEKSFSLASGEKKLVSFAIPDPTVPRHPRLVQEGTDSFEGWLARTSYAEWVAVGADGIVPIDLNQPGFELRLHAIDGRRWRLNLPENAPDGHVLTIPSGDATISGMVRNEDGSPLAGVQVEATVAGSRDACAARTNSNGVFALTGLQEVPYRLTLRTKPNDAFDSDRENSIRGYAFEMTDSAGEGTKLDLLLTPAPRDLELTGTVQFPDGTVPENALLVTHSTVLQGSLQVTLPDPSRIHHVAPDGSFEIRCVRGERLSLKVVVDGETVAHETALVPAAGQLPPFAIVLDQ